MGFKSKSLEMLGEEAFIFEMGSRFLNKYIYKIFYLVGIT